MPRRIGIAAALALVGTVLWLVLDARHIDAPDRPSPKEVERSRGGEPALHGVATETEQATAVDRPPQRESPSAPAARRQLRGRVVDSSGASVSRVTVYLLPKDESVRDEAEFKPAFVEVNEDGTFDLTVETIRGHWIGAAPRSQDGLLHAWIDGDTLQHGDRAKLRFVLEPAPIRRIEVIGVDGRPHRGVRLDMIPLEMDRIRTWSAPGDPTMGSWGRPIEPAIVHEVALPYDGPIRVKATGYDGTLAEGVMSAGQEHLTLRLRRGVTLRIRITNDEPAGLVHAYVWQLDQRGVRLSRGMAASRDGTIAFQDRLLPGSHEVRLSGLGIEPHTLHDVVIPDDQLVVTLDVELTLKRNLGRLVVRVPPRPRQKKHYLGRLLMRRSCDDPEADWVALSFGEPTPGVLRTVRFEAGTYDILVIQASGEPLAYHGALVQGVEVATGEEERIEPPLAPCRPVRMPTLDRGYRAVQRAFVRSRLGDMPLVLAPPNGMLTWTGNYLPPEGTPLGPYPGTPSELHVHFPDGTELVKALPVQEDD